MNTNTAQISKVVSNNTQSLFTTVPATLSANGAVISAKTAINPINSSSEKTVAQPTRCANIPSMSVNNGNSS